MDEIYVYFVELPPQINEVVLPCYDGYTIYIDSRLSLEQKQKMYLHALHHIHNHDFERSDVDEIEANAHKKIRQSSRGD